jgi:hypothetical protein
MESMRIPWLERKRSLPGDFGWLQNMSG